jgi:hypothetical protein
MQRVQRTGACPAHVVDEQDNQCAPSECVDQTRDGLEQPGARSDFVPRGLGQVRVAIAQLGSRRPSSVKHTSASRSSGAFSRSRRRRGGELPRQPQLGLHDRSAIKIGGGLVMGD